MAQATTFGRKRAPDLARPLTPQPEPEFGLSAEAEAFRAQLKASGPIDNSGFSGWRRSVRGRRLLAWFATFALLSPGLLCFLFQAPDEISGGLELAGLFASWWLRRERRRHLQQITQWEPPAGEEV
ncbi:MAG TPA: hypothetical protein VGI79_22815 [Caulobacteraceae bacterium]